MAKIGQTNVKGSKSKLTITGADWGGYSGSFGSGAGGNAVTPPAGTAGQPIGLLLLLTKAS